MRMKEPEKINKSKERNEEEVEGFQAMVLACRERPHLAFGALNKLQFEWLQKLAKTNSELYGILENYRLSAQKNFIGHQLAYERRQWLGAFPELQGNEIEFDVGVMANDNPVEYLHKRMQMAQIDKHGMVIVMKTLTGHIILLANHDLTQKNVISVEPNPHNKLFVYRNSKYICVPRFGFTRSTRVFCRQTGENLYSFGGEIGNKVLDNVLDEMYVREYYGPILRLLKITDTRAVPVYETAACCDLESLKLNIMPSPAGELILSVCIVCWKAKKSVLQTGCVIWELQIEPKNKKPYFAHAILFDGVFSVEIIRPGGFATEAIFIDADLGCFINMGCDEDGEKFRQFSTKHFLVLTWQKCGYMKFCVYNKIMRQVTRKFQVSVYPTEKTPFMNLIQERILVVTHRVPERIHRVRIMVFDILDKDPARSSWIFSDTYKYLKPTNEGLLEISANFYGTLTLTRKHFKTLSTKDSLKMLRDLENVTF